MTEPSIDIANMKEPIPGYTLEERIGVGGYGEVWRVNAPGGLKKAIKIVHGTLCDSRTEREMKAMERIRAVSHPMMLSVERVEVVNDQLLIVTELADGSLKDRFDECIKNGGGIPRDELLGYIRDAADALDFLFEKHQLQHLDVKPENLLMVGGRVKVADFGLIKDLADKSMSLVGGLTPMYAPPEVFDGAPCRHSDQYSLAIVYQEMLTGEAPFGGRTAAQLASQHVHCDPMVSVLPMHDRGPISRALSKDPERRYPSCRILVQELTKAPETEAARRIRRSRGAQGSDAKGRPASRGRRGAVRSQAIRQPPHTSMADGTVRLSQVGQLGAMTLPFPSTIVAQEPLEFTPGVDVRPTLYIGVGGAAEETLQQLKRRLADRMTPLSQLPSFGVMQLDTTFNVSGFSNDSDEWLNSDEMLAIPLREAGEYRDRSELLLEWLNRRWLYNIPRSLETEGLRPLGRLALVDHFESVIDALRRGISDIMTPESVAATSARLGVDLQTTAPRIVLVSSISGGVGSGCVLDLGYAVRDVLQEMGLSDDHVQGVLMHSTPRKASGRDIAIANALSCLSEFSYYASTEGGYPGEPACGIQPRTDRCAPFAHTYFTILGDDLDDDAFKTACRNVAEYLFQSTATSMASFFSACRKQQGPYAEQSEERMQLRSFGVNQVGGGESDGVQSMSELICRSLVEQWVGVGSPDDGSAALENRVAPHVDALMKKLNLTESDLLESAKTVAQATVSDDVDGYFRRIIAEHRAKWAGDEKLEDVDRAERLIAAIDELAIGGVQQTMKSPSLRSVVEIKFCKRVEQPRMAMTKWLEECIDRPSFRTAAALQAVHLISKKLNVLEQSFNQTVRQLERDIRSLGERIVSAAIPEFDANGQRKSSPISSDEDTALVAYATLRLLLVANQVAAQFIESLARLVSQDAKAVQDLDEKLREMARQFDCGKASFEADDSFTFDKENSNVLLTIQKQQLALANRLDELLQDQFFDKQVSLSHLLATRSFEWTSLMSAMRVNARRVVANRVSHTWTDQLFSDNLASSDSDVDVNPHVLETEIEIAVPELLALGGAKNVLVIAPHTDAEQSSRWKSKLEQAAGQAINFVQLDDNRVTICYETEQTPLRNVVSGLVGVRPDFVKLAERLHARIDIDWPPVL